RTRWCGWPTACPTPRASRRGARGIRGRGSWYRRGAFRHSSRPAPMSPRSAPLAAMAAMCAIWGYSWIVMKIALRHAHPFDFAAQRLVLGALLLFAILAATGRRLALSSYRMAFVLGLVQVG